MASNAVIILIYGQSGVYSTDMSLVLVFAVDEQVNSFVTVLPLASVLVP